MLLVLYPEARSTAQANWAAIRNALSATGLRVPELLDDDPELGAALEEDLGDRDLAAELGEASPGERARLLDEAEELLEAVRKVPREVARRNPPFDTDFFARELAHTRLWSLEAGGERPLDPHAAACWDQHALELARAAADGAVGGAVPTHRDFHANNLMRAPEGRLAPIDFQDLRIGPAAYDPVSLRFERAGASAPAGHAYPEAVLLQRAWKVLGTFDKMLHRGREVYRPHRVAAASVIRRFTSRPGPFEALLPFLR